MIALYGEKYFAETWSKWCDGVINIYHANKGNICMNLLEKIECPTLIVHGQKDSMLHPQHIPTLTNNIKQVKYVECFVMNLHNLYY